MHILGQFTQPFQGPIAKGVKFSLRSGFTITEGLT